jgi:hypothetical protein
MVVGQIAFGRLVFHYLPFANQRGLFLPEINLIVQTVRLVDNRLDYGVDDSTAVHGDTDHIADLVGFGLVLILNMRYIPGT